MSDVFSNFKIHTPYSICEGAVKIEELANFCKENKLQSVGICDSLNLCGAMEFAEKISKAGSQPIIGTQINFKLGDNSGKLPLFAMTELGYKNLTKLSSKSYLQSEDKDQPCCSLTDLEKLNEDLIVLSGGHRDFFGNLFKKNKLKQIEETLLKLREVFKNRIYLEIQRHNEPGELSYERFIINQSQSIEIPLIASQEVYYLKQDMFDAHDALICIKEKNFVDDNKRLKYSKEHFLKKSNDLKILFKDIPEALENNYNFPFRFSYKPKKKPSSTTNTFIIEKLNT